MALDPRRSSFRHRNQRIAFSDYGGRGAPLVLIPGLLLSREMHHPLATALARRGHRVITFDPPGHGASDRPRDMWRYSTGLFADDCAALLDHLGIRRAVVGGTSLGANVTLEMASRHPQRLSGMVVEMPALDNALPVTSLTFTSLMAGLILAEPGYRLLARWLRLVPRGLLPLYGNVVLDVLRQEPRPSAAVIHGLFFARIAPPREERRSFTTPALIIGHRRDPIHPFSDADMLARELANSRLVRASSPLELRFAPARLTDAIHEFLIRCSTSTSSNGRARSRSRRSVQRPA